MELPTHILVVEDNDGMSELIARIAQLALPSATVLQARSGLMAIRLFHAHRHTIQLVILDIELDGFLSSYQALSGREVCLKIRELDATVPILPCTVDIKAAPLLEDLGCAPLFTKQALAANPLAFVERIRQVLETPSPLRISPASLSYMLQRADDLVAGAQASLHSTAVILCGHTALRTALTRLIEGIGVHVLASKGGVAELGGALRDDATPVLVGTVDDLDLLRSAATAISCPLLALALRPAELVALSAHTYRTTNIVLYDEQGDEATLREAFEVTRRRERFLALPAATVAQVVEPAAGLTVREWEVVVAGLATDDTQAVADACALDPATIETYRGRARRRIGGSRQELRDHAQSTIVAVLGVMPQILLGGARERSVGG